MDWEGETVRWGGYDASFGTYTISNTTELFTLRFRVISQDWDTIPITIGRKTAGTELGWDIEVENTDGYVNKRMAPFDTRPVDGIYGLVYCLKRMFLNCTVMFFPLCSCNASMPDLAAFSASRSVTSTVFLPLMKCINRFPRATMR